MFATRRSGLWWLRWPRDQRMRTQDWIASRCLLGSSDSNAADWQRLHCSSQDLGRAWTPGICFDSSQSASHPSIPSLHLMAATSGLPTCSPHSSSDLSYSNLTSSNSCSCSRVFSGSLLPTSTLGLDCKVLHDHPSQRERAHPTWPDQPSSVYKCLTQHIPLSTHPDPIHPLSFKILSHPL